MIHDDLRRWHVYFRGEPWRQAFEFLQGLSMTAEDCSRIALRGDEMHAAIMTYSTRSPADAVLEAHDQYIDIQVSLQGSEAIEWFPRDRLEIKTPYKKELDCTFFHRPERVPVRIDNRPGYFSVLFPDDAHMPMLMPGQTPDLVKKVVIKIHRSLIRGE